MQTLTPPKRLVASISPQTLASLSARYTPTTGSDFIPLPAVLARISHFLRTRLGFESVFDTTFARHIALREHQREFFQRRSAKDQSQLPMLASACPGWICYAEKTHGELLPFISGTKSPQQVAGTLMKRWYARQSDVAGEVYHVTIMPCYDKKLEASRPDFFDDVLQTKDVDCVITTGELDKLMQEEGFDIRDPVHGEGAIEQAAAVPSITGGSGPKETVGAKSPILPSLLDQPGSSSGGYLFSVMEACWQEHLLGHNSEGQEGDSSSLPLPQLDVKIIRTADFTEYVLRSADGSILFKGAHCYGFRNLQNLVRKVQKQTGVKSRKGAAASSVNGEAVGASAGRGRMGLRGRGGARGGGMVKRGRGGAASAVNGGSDAPSTPATDDESARGYDYVEVMACPGGCVNGGGQIRPPTKENNSLPSSGISMAISSGLQEQTEAQRDDVLTPASQQQQQPLSAARSILGDLDPEGFSSGASSSQSGFSTPLTDHSMEEPDMSQGWQGTSKEWVKRVEEAYWQAAKAPSLAEQFRKRPASVSGSAVDNLAEEIMKSVGAADVFLRTSYRAVQDEAVNGLAVQW